MYNSYGYCKYEGTDLSCTDVPSVLLFGMVHEYALQGIRFIGQLLIQVNEKISTLLFAYLNLSVFQAVQSSFKEA